MADLEKTKKFKIHKAYIKRIEHEDEIENSGYPRPQYLISYRASSSDSYSIISEAQCSKSKRETIGFLSLCCSFINSSFSVGWEYWWGSGTFPFFSTLLHSLLFSFFFLLRNKQLCVEQQCVKICSVIRNVSFWLITFWAQVTSSRHRIKKQNHLYTLVYIVGASG